MAKILIVDDDSALRRMVKRVLIDAGHQVTEASNGIEGMRAFRAEEPDVVVMDILMPEQEGISTILEMRATGSKVGIIAISGGGVGKATDYLDMAGDLGADSALPKPFRAPELLAAIDALLNREKPAT